MKENRLGIGLLAFGAFLAPWAGGQISVGDPAIDPFSPFGAIFLAGGASTLSHALIGLFAIVTLVLMLRRQVVQAPRIALTLPLGLWFVFLLGSVLVSDYRFDSIRLFVQFALYAVALFATVAAVGRQAGPRVVLMALFGGVFLTALIGLREYGDMKAIDPNWRIFANWNNPNAAAAMLLVGTILGIGLTMTAERAVALLLGFGTVLVALALVLTGSKGALALGLPVALATLGAGLARRSQLGAVGGLVAGAIFVGSGFLFLRGQIWAAVALGGLGLLGLGFLNVEKEHRLVALRPLGVLMGLAAMVFLIQTQAAQDNNAKVKHAAPLARIQNVGQTQDQSSEFRLNLWRTAVALTREEPYGVGLGAFQFESGRPGLTTQTVLAHNSYLQIMCEASPLALLAFLVFGIVWMVHVHRGGTSLPADRRILRGTVVAAVVGLMVHSAVDSNLYYFGLGFVLFILLGLGLLLSADAVAPEYVPGGIRAVVAIAALGFLFSGTVMGVGEYRKGVAKAYLQGGQFAEALTAADSAAALTPTDPDVWTLRAGLSRSSEEQLGYLARAAKLGPSTRNLRALASAQHASGQSVAAIGSLNQALRLDPLNLFTLNRLAEIQFATGAISEGEATLRRLIEAENSAVFKVRSQPDAIPTETLDARLQLASRRTEPSEVRELLVPAIEGYLRYAEITVPLVYRNAGFPQPGFDTPDQAVGKLTRALEAAQRLAAVSPGDRELAERAASKFDAAIRKAPAKP